MAKVNLDHSLSTTIPRELRDDAGMLIFLSSLESTGGPGDGGVSSSRASISSGFVISTSGLALGHSSHSCPPLLASATQATGNAAEAAA